ncbi:dihydroxyacetone kinase subunit DhaL [Staphylococcus warneri]|jgi:phosphoenolpyruvate---glycerone phosphotransferase subunit DhaL|uniref:phosphoenolpyruvate--glycerone phosphotransferase n=2 Tax=Staphylococcus TaxID=1279 RepID=A0A364URD8_STAWA|nr:MULTISPECIES: dihydroxyacetone kinase subunit DhaL [Staphylococcus]MBJ7884381.1 dihydroxyacetone kinase subunit L [Bacillaceae bacterium HSR45]MCC8990107.1 dihydroxyacetone kinase subunit L [Staphylococcus sp.]PAK73240.1 dihydroxyacetone kinase subunit L [Staphylococcus pasteuri]COQ06334.1 dihydroxyacetone kinase family protein [Streptococcus pneumoniae]SKR87108.1 dihydroxyacetone kinase DhaL subunit [Mycobacteroides abscessus subsp. abscessus]
MDIQKMKQQLLDLETTFKEQEDSLTELDRAIGDGDHGVNMLRGFESLKDKIDDSSMQSVFKSTGMCLMSNIGGASGPLYGFSFVKMAEVVKDDIDHNNLVELLETFAEAIAKRGKVELNEKTMYDVIARAYEAVKKGEQVDLNRLQSFAEETVDMVATKGRASYFKEASKGYMDPGAQSMVYVLHALIGDEA